MKNNKGFAKYELLTIICLILSITCILMGCILKGASNQKINTMKKDALSLVKTVTTNIDYFHNTDVVYLSEVVDEQLLPDNGIKSPFSKKLCNNTESKVEMVKGIPYVTLLCDSYLIEKTKINDFESVEVFKVNNWQEDNNIPNAQSKTLYNCKIKGKEVYDNYYEEFYFVSMINKDYGTNYYLSNDVNDTCKVVKKKFYRSKKEFY